MAGGDRVRLVLMAGVASMLRIACRVAHLAGDLPLPSVIEWEDVQAQGCRSPGIYGMAVLALPSEEASVNLGLGMAFHARGGCASKLLPWVALLAL